MISALVEKIRMKVGKRAYDSNAPLAVKSFQAGSNLSGLLGFQSLSIIEKQF